eukprot:NODE_57_length_28844_cov_0.352687.p2 type:complete len:705 gc:universal NODE_57_length_28844_cov_0.352687:10591-12705(+)
MFQAIRIQPFLVDEEDIDILNPVQDYLALSNALVKCKINADDNGSILISELQCHWLEFLCGLTGPLSAIPLYYDRVPHPFSTILFFKFSTSELKTHNTTNSLELDKTMNTNEKFWSKCMSLLNVLETYPQYVQDICLDWMEQAIYDDTIPFLHLTEIAKVYSQFALDTRLSQHFISEEKALENIKINDTCEIEKLVLPSEKLIRECLENVTLYSKIIRLWSSLPNCKGIFDFDLTDYFLTEMENTDKDGNSWKNIVVLADFCRYLHAKNHIYILFHLFVHGSDKNSKEVSVPSSKLKEFILSVMIDTIDQDDIDTLVTTLLNPELNPIKSLSSHFHNKLLVSSRLLSAFEYILPYYMPSHEIVGNLLEFLVKKQLQLLESYKIIRTILIHFADSYHNKKDQDFQIFKYTELLLVVFCFKHSTRNEQYYDLLRVYLSLILTSENDPAIDQFYMSVCKLFNNTEKENLLFLNHLDIDRSVFLDILCKILSDHPLLQIHSLEATWEILKDFNSGNSYFELYISFIKYLQHSKRLSDFHEFLQPIYQLNTNWKIERIIEACNLLSGLIISSPSTVQHHLTMLKFDENHVISHLVMLLNHPISDVFWSVCQVLFYVFVNRQWVEKPLILKCFSKVEDSYWSNILLLLATENYEFNASKLRKIDLKKYHNLFLSVMNEQLPDIKDLHFEVLSNVSKQVNALTPLPRLNAE